MHDIVIRGGKIVDGSGADAFAGDVALQGDRIVQVGGKAGPGKREIDADGALVTPGFVDIHTHYDGQVTWDPYLTPSSWHGVTSLVMGNCGVGFAPARPDRHDWLIGRMEGVEDIPGSALAEGIDWTWESFPDYLDALDVKPLALDVGTQVPHGAVRAYVMGERGARNQPATPDDIAAMADIVEQGLRAGALGFSSSRTMLHRAVDGEPVPGTFAGHDELMGIGRACGRAGHGVFEISSDLGIMGTESRFKDDVIWMRDLSRETGLPVSFILTQDQRWPDEWRNVAGWASEAVADGARLMLQTGSKPPGLLMGLGSTMHPFQGHPTYMEIADLPLTERARRLSDPAVKARLLAEESTLKSAFNRHVFNHFAGMFPLGDPPDYEPGPDQSVAALADKAGRDPRAFLLDTMLGRDGTELVYYPLQNYAYGDFSAVYEMLNHPLSLLSLSDGGAHCGLICDASAPTFVLTHWVRDRQRGPRLRLETAVRKQTSATASAYGLNDRGLLKPGYRADVNVIDFDGLRLHAPERVADLPAGGQRLVQRGDGYLATIVAGTQTYANGEATGALPGKLVRGPQAV
ncbi:MAG: amidohydrolase family protein [Alphaproteobacteria bacterium]